MVYVPYCTGDLHLGTVTTPYSATLTVQHKGFVNGTAALDALASTFPRATEIVVAGESAGAAPAPLYAGLAADLLPDASVTVLADGAGSYPDQPGINAAIGAALGHRGDDPGLVRQRGADPRAVEPAGSVRAGRSPRARPRAGPPRLRLRRRADHLRAARRLRRRRSAGGDRRQRGADRAGRRRSAQLHRAGIRAHRAHVRSLLHRGRSTACRWSTGSRRSPTARRSRTSTARSVRAADRGFGSIPVLPGAHARFVALGVGEHPPRPGVLDRSRGARRRRGRRRSGARPCRAGTTTSMWNRLRCGRGSSICWNQNGGPMRAGSRIATTCPS